MYPFNQRQFSRRLFVDIAIAPRADTERGNPTLNTPIQGVQESTSGSGSTASNDSSIGETSRSTQQRLSIGNGAPHANPTHMVQTHDKKILCKNSADKSPAEEISRGSSTHPPVPRIVSEEDQLQALPIRRLRFYKGKGDKGDFCTYTVTSSTPPAYPPIMEDGEPNQPAALFIHIHPSTLDVHIWMWTSSQNWVPVSDGAVHPTMPYRCLYVKKMNGSVEVNWVLRDTVRTYQQRALRGSRMQELGL